MRANTQALIADPRFSLVQTAHGTWGQLKTVSPREMLEACQTYAQTANEAVWKSSPHWIGLGEQSLAALHASGIPEKARDALKSAFAKLDIKPSRPGRVIPSIVGGSWSTPAVLANLPLAARLRSRSKLPPLNISLMLCWSSSVDDATLAPIFARLARAIWDYTLDGGAVSLTVACAAAVAKQSTSANGLICTTHVPCSDISQLALALSVPYLRAVCGPLGTAFSDAQSDCLTAPLRNQNPVAGSIYIGGRTSNGQLPELTKVFEALAIR